MELNGGLDTNHIGLCCQGVASSCDRWIADGAGVLRNEIIVKALRAAKEPTGIRRSFFGEGKDRRQSGLNAYSLLHY